MFKWIIIAILATSWIGCAAETITFNKDVAPIVFKNCAACHRPGEVAPFPLLNYTDVAKRARQIVEVTQAQIMPPWKAVAGHGSFIGENRLTNEELATLQKWLDAGKPEGLAADLPPAPTFTSGWILGEPQLKATMQEPYPLRAEGADDYRCFVVPLNLTEDVFLSTFEFKPGNSRIVHHAILSVDYTGEARRLDAADPGVGYKSFGATGTKSGWNDVIGVWTPGMVPTKLPDGIGLRIKKGADLVIQIHYHPSGKAEKDQSSVGLHLLPAPPSRTAHYTFFHQPKIEIPAGATHHTVTVSQYIPQAGVLLAILPHMHLIGREMKVTLQVPGAEKESLIWIKDWNFNWQNQYVYKKPVLLPGGSTVQLEASFDNSANNPANPSNPPQLVRYGEQTNNEMAGCIVLVANATLQDVPNLKVKEETLANYAGRYSFGDTILTVRKPGAERLIAEAAGKTVQLIAYTNTTFLSLPDEGVFSFKVDAKGSGKSCTLFQKGKELQGQKLPE